MTFTNSVQDIGKSLGNFNLASTLQNPGKFAEIFSDSIRGHLATDAVKLLAGPDASKTIENLMNEIKEMAIDSKHVLLLFLL